MRDEMPELPSLRSVLYGCALALLPGAARADFTLQQAWAEAEPKSLDLQLADEQVAQAATLRLQVLSTQLPRLRNEWQFIANQNEVLLPEAFLSTGQSPAEFLPILPQTQFLGSLTLQQPLLRPALIPGMQAAQRLLRAQRAERRRASQSWRASVARAYYALLLADAATAVNEAALTLAELGLELAESELDSGLGTQRGVLQSRLARSRAQRETRRNSEQHTAAQDAWRAATGLEPRGDLSWPDLPSPPTERGVAIEGGLAERADLQAAALRERAAQDERKARDLGWLPTLDFAFEQRFRPTPTLFDPYPYTLHAAFQLNWSLFDGGLRIARTREQASRARAASIQVRRKQRQVGDEIRQAWEALSRAEANRDAVGAEVALATEDLELAQRALDAGSATERELRAAQLAQATSQLEDLRARMARDLALIELLLATGEF